MTEVCQKIQDGTHFSPDQEKQLPQGQYPYVTAKNVRPHGLDLDDLTYLDEAEHRQIYERCDPHTGDVLLVKDGVNTGDAAINTVDGEISLLSSVCMLRPRHEVLVNQFLRYFLLSPQGYRSLTGQMTGTAIKRIILRKIRDTPVPIAPLSEQRRIVAKIEELFSDLDAGVAALKRIKANLKRYRAAVLKAAVEGRLTEAWRAKHPNTEPATKLLERILAERRKKWEEDQLAKFAAVEKTPPKGWREKYVEPAAPDTSGLPELPQGWVWASFETVMSESLRNGHSAKASGDGTGIRTLTLTAVTLGDFSEKNTKLTIAKPEAIEDLWLQPGDFLIERSNTPELVGTARLYRGPTRFAIFPDLLIRVRVFPSVVKGFVDTVLQSSFTRRYFQWRAKGLAGSMPKIDQGTILSLPVPVPPFAEQEEIASEIERRLSIIAAAQAQVQANLKRSARLRQSILKRAFEGKLVPQDPTDESAEKLLERIRQERTATNGSVAPRPTRGRASKHQAEDDGAAS